MLSLLPALAVADEAGLRSCADNSIATVPDGAVFGAVRIDNNDVFDLDDPKENGPLYRFANRLHIETRPLVIEQRLLFRSGDPYSLQVVEESERLLRATSYLYDARICLLGYHDGTVDVSVWTRDVWTLRPGFSFGRGGGENESGISLEDKNLLGTGMSVSLDRKNQVDRNSTVLGFSDDNLLGRWLKLDVALADASDGHTYDATLEQPFYALDVRRARGLRLYDDDRIDSMYERGEVVDEFRAQRSYQRFFWGRSPGLQEGWTRRWTLGLVRDFTRFSPSEEPGATNLLPEDRKLLYPFAGFEVLRDRYVTAHNNNQIGRTEDFFLGPRLYVELGLATEALGSDRDALITSALWSYGSQRTPATKWLVTTDFSGRAETSGGFADALASGRFEFYHRQSERRLLFAAAQVDVGHNLDLDHQLLLGGDNGLRGYPLRYQGGDQRALFTVEQRYFTSWQPFRLFYVGGAAFFDVGRAWGTNPFATDNLGWLKDVGFGARFAGTRAGNGTVVHVDLAFPLDGDSSIDNVQLVIETKRGF
jgi:hypothetical protein